MSYPIMPPGSYLFWRIGMVSPLYRWALTVCLCIGTIFLWYSITTRFLLRATSQKTAHAQCALQVAELACYSDVTVAKPGLLQEQIHPSLNILHLCDQHGLVVQSCSCSKPTAKNNLSVQRVSMVCTGTLAHIHTFFATFSASGMCIANIEVALKQQPDKLYSGTIIYDIVV